MTDEIKCEICNRTFGNADGLDFHNKAKHSENIQEEKKPFPVKKIRNWVIFIIVLGLIVWGVISLSSGSQELDGTSIKCSPMEGNVMHIHPQITIIVDNEQVAIPANIGIKQSCMYWIHTHSPDGVLHVESPVKRDFYLRELFEVWGKDPLEEKIIIKITLNGETYSGNYNDILLKDSERIVIEAK